MSDEDKKAQSNTPPPPPENLDEKIAKWIESKEGIEALLATRDTARAAADRVQEEAKIEAALLRKPVTH